jgi:hypothetical protein
MDKAYQDIEKDLEDKLSSFGFRDYVSHSNSVLNSLKSRDKRLPGMPMQELNWDIDRQKRQPHKTESIY